MREPSSVYLVRSTWQHTDLGRLPSDWNVKQIGELQPFVTSGSRGWARFYSETGSPFIRITNLSRSRIYLDLADLRSVNLPASDSEGARTQLAVGDVLISVTADIGIVGYVSSRVPTPAYINQHIALVRFDRVRVNPKFVSYFLASEQPQRRFRSLTDAGAKAGMNLPTVRTVQVALPPTVREQDAVAEALSDTDALVESLEQLLAKKRQIKQGAMQELLTGRRRLPGFEAKREEQSLDELFSFSGGHTASRDQLGSHGHCYLHYGDIHTSTKTYVELPGERETIPKLDIALKKVSPNAMLAHGDVVFVDASEDDEGTSRHVVVSNPAALPFIAGLHTIVAKAKSNELGLLYRRHCFQTASVKAQFRFFAVGTKVSGVSKSNIRKITVLVPSTEEQTAIAATLSDMDAELTALEARLAKTRLLKQGMAQALLTGRIRLV